MTGISDLLYCPQGLTMLQHVSEFSFLSKTEHCMYVAHFVCLSLSCGHLGGFHLLATVNNAVQIPDLNSLGHKSRYGIAGSCDSSIFMFLRNCHTVSTAAVPVYIPKSSAQALQVTSFSAVVLFLPPLLPSAVILTGMNYGSQRFLYALLQNLLAHR